MKNSILVKSQTKTFTKEGFRVDGGHGRIVVKVRYDDQCGNGHNSFSITGTLYRDDLEQSCGCIHEDIIEFMPELEPLVKWHSMNSDGPTYYIANTMYHVSDTDSSGLKKGEYGAYKLQLVSSEISHGGDVTLYKSGQMYNNKQNNPNLKKCNDKELLLLEEFKSNLKVNCTVVTKNSSYSLSEGKTPNLESGRSMAIWPDATLEQLRDKESLEERLPALIEEFITVVESLGMVY